MKVKDLIEKLDDYLNAHGDIEVVIEDSEGYSDEIGTRVQWGGWPDAEEKLVIW